jgi:hypothetical protein
MLSLEQRQAIAERLGHIAQNESSEVAKEFIRIADHLDPTYPMDGRNAEDK